MVYCMLFCDVLYGVFMDFISVRFFSKINFENGGGNSTVTDDCIIGELKVITMKHASSIYIR